MGKQTRKILSALLALVCLVSSGIYAKYQLDHRKAADAYTQAQQLSLQENSPEILPAPEAAATPEPEPRWVPVPVTDDPHMEELARRSLAVLRQQNPDVAGWIWIPDSEISYPLMQGADNDFYLNHTWQKTPSTAGSIFLEWQISPDFSEFNTIVYGHNMQDGSMFHQLHDFRDIRFRDEHPYVYILTDAGVYRYEIFSCYQAEVGSDTYQFAMQWEKTKQEYIDMAIKKSVIDPGIAPAVTDRILTLSTCSGLGGALGRENRWVVHAYLPMEFTE